MVVPNLDQFRTADPRQLFRVGKGNDFIISLMQNDRSSLHRIRCPPVLPCRAKEDEFGVSAVNVHRYGTTPRRSDDHIRMVLVEFCLSSFHSCIEVVVVKLGVKDRVSVVFQISRFDATGNRLPAVEEEDFHAIVSIPARILVGKIPLENFKEGLKFGVVCIQMGFMPLKYDVIRVLPP